MPLPTESNIIDEDPTSGPALDALYKEHGDEPAAGESPAEAAPAAVPEAKPVAEPSVSAVEKPVDEPAPADPKTDDGLPAEAPVSRVPAVDEVQPAAVVEETDLTLKAFDEVKLRPDASQKTKDTFANLKKISTEALRAANAEKLRLRQEHEQQIADLRKTITAPSTELSPEVKAELEALRGFKATFDIENDPKFKEEIATKMEIPKNANYDAIYAVLQSHGLPDSEVKAVREMSEADRVANIGEFMEKLPRLSRMKVEAKLLENLNLDSAREKAIAEARNAAAGKKAEFREAPEKLREKEVAEVKSHADRFRAHTVFKKHEVTAGTPAEEKKRFEAENARIDGLTKIYEEAVSDATPAGRAENAFGVVLAHHFKAQADAATAKIQKLEAELEAIKKRGGLGNLGKVVNTPADGVRPKVDADRDAGASLDDLAKAAGIPV